MVVIINTQGFSRAVPALTSVCPVNTMRCGRCSADSFMVRYGAGRQSFHPVSHLTFGLKGAVSYIMEGA